MNPVLLNALASSILAGEATRDGVVERCSKTLGRRWPWLRGLARRYLQAVRGRVRPRRRDVVRFLRVDRGLQKAWTLYAAEIRVRQWVPEAFQMQPAPAAATWKLPSISNVLELANWLGISGDELEWLADLMGFERKRSTPKSRHYHYRLLAKPGSGVRLIESPKARLKAVQRKILRGILEQVPIHPSVHGFVKGRSIQSFAAPHAGRRIVVRMDLEDFFPTVSGARAQALFRTFGYPEPIADLLGGLCTNITPTGLWDLSGPPTDRSRMRDARDLYSRPHLPQGAPTSPMIANLCAYRVDCRLAALAKSANARYTRYADDLAFSANSDFAKRAERFSLHAAAILLEEGFRVQHRKTRVMRRGVRQQLAGLVVNDHPNIRRSDFDQLKAVLTNCVRHGPETQSRGRHPDFRLHLYGRVAFIGSISPAKGRKLRAIFDEITWPG